MKKIVPIILVSLTGFIGSCGNDDDGPQDGGISLTLLKSESGIPANVTLFFKASFANGGGVDGLTTDDITIYEDEELISEFEAGRDFLPKPEEFLYSTLLLLDLSGSVLEASALNTLKEAANAFISNVLTTTASDPVEIAIYWFDGEENIHLLQTFTNDRLRLSNSIASITSEISRDNSTNLNGAIVQGVNVVENRVRENTLQLDVLTAGTIITFTDGKDRAGRVSDASANASIVQLDESVTSLTIGLGGEIDQKSLREIGRDGFQFSENLADLTETFQETAGKIKTEANSFYIFEYCSPKRTGRFSLRIDVVKEIKLGSLFEEFSAN